MADSIGPWKIMMVCMSRSRKITKKPINWYTGDIVCVRKECFLVICLVRMKLTLVCPRLNDHNGKYVLMVSSLE